MIYFVETLSAKLANGIMDTLNANGYSVNTNIFGQKNGYVVCDKFMNKFVIDPSTKTYYYGAKKEGYNVIDVVEEVLSVDVKNYPNKINTNKGILSEKFEKVNLTLKGFKLTVQDVKKTTNENYICYSAHIVKNRNVVTFG